MVGGGGRGGASRGADRSWGWGGEGGIETAGGCAVRASAEKGKLGVIKERGWSGEGG